MRDYLLFAVLPYAAVLAFVPICMMRCVLRRGGIGPALEPRAAVRQRRLPFAVWRASLAIVALGHAIALVFPDYLLIWNRQLPRLIALEVCGVLAGTVALVGLLITVRQPLRAARRSDVPSPADVIAATLALVGMASGVAIALLYRWASSWSEVTLVPYLRSLAGLAPATTLVTHLPLLVKLHVVCAFALIAVLPFTGVGVLVPLQRILGPALMPRAAIAAAAFRRLTARITTQVDAWSGPLLRNRREEN